MADTPVSQKVFISREQNRNMIIEELKKYLELENVDLVKSSFLSFIVEALATLTSNLMFYQTSVYREFFLTKAQLPDSIYNLAAFIGYEGQLATYSNVNVLFEMPFGFSETNTTITIPEGFKVFANDEMTFSTYYETTIKVTSNSSVVITAQEGTKVFNIPVVSGPESFSFALNVRQLTTEAQEFQIPADLQIYQFHNVDVTFIGKLADIEVKVREIGQTGWDIYTQYDSLYLMDENTKGYVLRRTDTGIGLSFGNGIIGYQAPAGSTIEVSLILTNGENGNVIAGSIRTGARIYNTLLSGVTELVNYTVVNIIGATGGTDEEGIEDVRKNSIINLTALERTITEHDYINSDIIIDGSPIGPNSLPVLKRSDIKINEISLFITLLYLDDIVPTRNGFTTFNNSDPVPRKTVIDINGTDFYTLFDMTIETLNTVADYSYVLFELEQVPALITSYNSDYSLYADNLVVTTSGTSVDFALSYFTTASDSEDVTATMEILETGSTFTMDNDATSNEFTLLIPDYTVIANGELTYYFTLNHPTEGDVGKYQNTFILRQSLENYTRSNIVTDGTNYTVYDIPLIEKDYYDNLTNQREFETNVLQSLLTTLTFQDYKMMTDFVNIKFGNTIGELQNMQLNETNTQVVKDIASDPSDPCVSPVDCTPADRYIILNGTGEWIGKDGQIAECYIDGTSTNWVYFTPNTDDIVYVTDKSSNYIYGNGGWVLPNYNIPLEIQLDIFKSDEYSGTISTLANTIRTTLVEAFKDRFGIEIKLYRSEIIDVVQDIDGVDHCRLIKPVSNIFFNFDLINLTQDELLEYGPEYVYFSEDSIELKIF